MCEADRRILFLVCARSLDGRAPWTTELVFSSRSDRVVVEVLAHILAGRASCDDPHTAMLVQVFFLLPRMLISPLLLLLSLLSSSLQSTLTLRQGVELAKTLDQIRKGNIPVSQLYVAQEGRRMVGD